MENTQEAAIENSPYVPEGETPARILDLCFVSFREKGFANVALDDISKELRISKKTIYKYFKSKEDVLARCFDVQIAKAEKDLKKINIEKSGGAASFIELSRFYRSVSALFEPLLTDSALDEFPHLREKYQVFESLSLKKSFSKFLKNLRNAKAIQYPSPTRDLVSAWLEAVKGMKNTGEVQLEFICKNFFKGLDAKQKKKK